MNKTPLPARFAFTRSQPSDCAPEAPDLEILILPLTLHGKDPTELSAHRRWRDPQAIQQYRAKSKEAIEPQAPSRSTQVTFSSGGASCFLFISPEISTHELHNAMRANLLPLLCTAKEGTSLFSRILLSVDSLTANDQERVLLAFSFLCSTAGWKPESFRRSQKPSKPRRLEVWVTTSLPDASAEEIVRRGMILGRANSQVRSLAQLPANRLSPSDYRAWIAKYARGRGLRFEFLDRARLARMGAGAFLAVLRADPKSQGGIARISYIPKRAPRSNQRSVALVGKGVCSDTGGYNIKTGDTMLGMHMDMTGSALALALCGAYAELKADFEVHAYLAIAENLISPTAYKPNEVAVALDGTSIEVVDTDAEGRMLLADTLAWARKNKPTLAIDFATLTYQAMTSVDTRRSAVFSNRNDLLELAVRCGRESGERVWGFPIESDDHKALESKIADIRQCASSRFADHIYAAAFLSRFVGDEVPWVHVDLASASHSGGLGLIDTDTTGFGVLWADRFLRQAH